MLFKIALGVNSLTTKEPTSIRGVEDVFYNGSTREQIIEKLNRIKSISDENPRVIISYCRIPYADLILRKKLKRNKFGFYRSKHTYPMQEKLIEVMSEVNIYIDYLNSRIFCEKGLSRNFGETINCGKSKPKHSEVRFCSPRFGRMTDGIHPNTYWRTKKCKILRDAIIVEREYIYKSLKHAAKVFEYKYNTST